MSSSSHTAISLQGSKSRRKKFVNVIANPDSVFKHDAQTPPPESRSKLEDSRWLKAFFGNGRGIDFGSGAHRVQTSSQSQISNLDTPIFNERLISPKVATELPQGFSMRPLCRGDYCRGYMELMRVLGRTGSVSQEMWTKRCDWLQSMSTTYYIAVITVRDLEETEERVVASGTLMFKHKFLHGLGIVGHIEDIAIAKEQKGKKMSLRMLEALTYAAEEKGCYKTVVNCSEDNEAFYAQLGYAKEAGQMVIHHFRKREEQFYS